MPNSDIFNHAPMLLLYSFNCLVCVVTGFQSYILLPIGTAQRSHNGTFIWIQSTFSRAWHFWASKGDAVALGSTFIIWTCLFGMIFLNEKLHWIDMLMIPVRVSQIWTKALWSLERYRTAGTWIPDVSHNRRSHINCSASVYFWWSWIWWKYSFRNLVFLVICAFYCWVIYLPTQNWKWCPLYNNKLLLFNTWFCTTWYHYMYYNWIQLNLSGK